MIESPQALLLLPHLRIQNANLLSSPMTWGFPAPSAFAGFVHALGRKLTSKLDLQLGGVGMICHKFDPLVFKAPGNPDNILSLTKNPGVLKDKTKGTVKPRPFNEEGRVHLEVSLLIGVSGTELFDVPDQPRVPGLLSPLLLALLNEFRPVPR